MEITIPSWIVEMPIWLWVIIGYCLFSYIFIFFLMRGMYSKDEYVTNQDCYSNAIIWFLSPIILLFFALLISFYEFPSWLLLKLGAFLAGKKNV